RHGAEGRPAGEGVRVERAVSHRGTLLRRRTRRRVHLLHVLAPVRSRARVGDRSIQDGAARPPSGRRELVSHAATAEHHGVEPAETPLTPESWGKLGMWIFL